MNVTDTIAIIGAGNMGTSLIGGLIQNGHNAHLIIATDPDAQKLELLKQKFNIKVTSHNREAINEADVVVFAIKPQLFKTVVAPLKEVVQKRKPLIISIAAGIRLESIEAFLGNGLSIVRAMPNTAALINAGVTALYANSMVTPPMVTVAESLLRSVGTTLWLSKETLMDTVTALSGSGPAYFFLMMEALQQAGVSLGLSLEEAQLLTLQTALGAARMAIESGESLSALRQKVTSKGGTTEKAIEVLESHHIQDILAKAVFAAKMRSEELAELMGKV